MLKTFLMAGLLSGALLQGALTPQPALADETMTVEEKLDKLTTELDLTVEQQTAVRAILEDKKARLAESPDQREAVKEDAHAKIRALLTDEQKLEYDAMKAEKKKEEAPAETR
jgi:hypothetical protein